MSRTEIVVDTPDTPCRATLHTAGDTTARPGVVLYPDAGGVRETIAAMADRLARTGHTVLVPDIYHRTPYRPFDTTTLFDDPEEFARLGEMVRALTPSMIADDAGAYLDALAARPETTEGPMGTIGYCFGGSMALRAAAVGGERVGAAASFHGGNLAVADDPESPHLLAGRIRAAVHVGAAADDPVFGPDQEERLRRAFDEAGVDAVIDHYGAAHGFAVPDNPTHDDDADRRHQEAQDALFARHLGR